MVCGSPFQDAPKTLSVTINCPYYCKIHELNTKQFQINSAGQMSINATHQYSNVRINKSFIRIMEKKKIIAILWTTITFQSNLFQHTSVKDYCVTYACHQDNLKWEVKADACLCYDVDALKSIDSTIPKEMHR